MGLRSITPITNPAVNGWARENLIGEHNIQTPPIVSTSSEYLVFVNLRNLRNLWTKLLRGRFAAKVIGLSSAKRTTENLIYVRLILSRPFHGLIKILGLCTPPMNRWAIVIRRLRRLLQQSLLGSVTKFVIDRSLARLEYNLLVRCGRFFEKFRAKFIVEPW